MPHIGGAAALEPLRRRGHTALSKFCLALPEADAYTVNGQHTTFTVRGRTFVYYLDDHHGDGRLAIWCKVGEMEQAALVTDEPVRYFLPAYIARNGWVGLRLDVGKVDWDEVEDLVLASYYLVAPKRLSALITA